VEQGIGSYDQHLPSVVLCPKTLKLGPREFVRFHTRNSARDSQGRFF